MACSRCRKAKRKCVHVKGRDICERCMRLGYDCDLNFKKPSHLSPTMDRFPNQSNKDSSHMSVQDHPSVMFSKISSSPNSATHTESSKRLRSTDAALNRAPLDNPDQGQDCGSQRPCHRRGPAAFHYNPCESPAQPRSPPSWTPPQKPRLHVTKIDSPVLSGRWEPPKWKHNQAPCHTPKPDHHHHHTSPFCQSICRKQLSQSHKCRVCSTNRGLWVGIQATEERLSPIQHEGIQPTEARLSPIQHK